MIAIDNVTAVLIHGRDKLRKSPQAKKLNRPGAVAILTARVTVTKLEAALEVAKEIRDLVQGRYLHLIPLSKDEDERKKGIRITDVGGIKIRVTPVAGSERFNLSTYKEKGHTITPEMREAMKTSDGYDKWTVKDERGPRTAGAVEPA